jgi:phosphoglycerol transferase MdoB-like AlkP superfamily enzyme
LPIWSGSVVKRREGRERKGTKRGFSLGYFTGVCHMKEQVRKYIDPGLAHVAGLAFILNFIIESLGRHSPLQSFIFLFNSPKVFLYNVLLIFITLSFSLMLKRRIFYYVVASVLWLALGITNGVILSFRMTPFTVSDLALFENGISIIANYMSTWQIVLLVLGIIAVIALFVIAFIFAPKKQNQGIPYKTNLLLIIVFCLLFAAATNAGIENRWLSKYFPNLGYAYRDYGVPYCFLNTWLIRGISAPTGYSADMVREIFDDGIPMGIDEADPAIPVLQTVEGAMRRRPNIVFVQLESFIDPNLIRGVEFSEDPIPNFHMLQQQGSTGFLRVPSVGAGTANTEFEVLTGMRIRFFGPGEYPYKTVLKETTCESACYILKDLGYTSHAIHNHRGAFYGRNLVFSNLGFDTFTSIEYMNNVKKTPRNWAKDYVLIDEIRAAMESTEGKDFVFTISVQGHGKYPEKQVIPDEDLKIRVTDGIEDETQRNAMVYYVNQLYEMDQFIGDLVEALKDYEETVIVFYGDHFPVLDLSEEDMENGSIYETEYVIVSNFRLPKIDEHLYTYQLSARVFELLGIHSGILTWYHQTKSDYGNYLDNLKILQYDMLYGNRYIYGGQNPFEPTELKMGVREIRVDKIFNFGKSTYVVGENFTPYSKVAVNGDFVETVFVNPTILRIPDGVKSKDPLDFSISQVGKYSTVLSTLEDVE